MKRTFRVWATTLVLMICSSVGQADMCDDIDALADWWDQYTVWVEGLAESGFTQDQADQADTRMAEGVVSTRAWADFLVNQGGDVASSLGQPLHQALYELEASEDADTMFGALGDIIDILDATVAVCDGDTSGAAEPAQSPRVGGSITVHYDSPPAEPGYAEMAEGLRESGVYEAIAGTVVEAVALPVDLRVDFTSCGQPNAFYDPSSQRIIMCYEFFGLFASVFASDEVSDEEFAESVLGAGAFFFLHELGHALVDLFEIPITGREEDSVDGLATLILIHGEGESALFAAIDNFDAMAASMAEGGGGQLAFWDEHSLNSQRLYDVACLIYGSDPQGYAHMVGPDALPEERAVRCPDEFQQKNQAWDVLLEPYFLE